MLEILIATTRASTPAPVDSFLGEIDAASFITGNALTTAVGITLGTSLSNDTAGWLKYLHKGKTLYIAKRPLRRSIGWDDLDTKGVVFGTTTVVIGGLTYKVRLMTGATGNPYAAGSAGGEWNDLIYPVHVDDPSGKNWASYTSADLGIVSTGGYTFCQETYLSDTSRRCVRGGTTLIGMSNLAASAGNTSNSWRPVLELVE